MKTAIVESEVTWPLTGPYDAAALLTFLGRRTLSGVEVVGPDSYARTLRLPHGPGSVSIRFADHEITAQLSAVDRADLPHAAELSRRVLDLDTDLDAVRRHLAPDPLLGGSIHAAPGLRVPGYVDGFEVAVRAVVGQQVSVAGARTVLSRLVSAYGERVCAEGELTMLFPTAEALAAVRPETLPMPRSRARALVSVAAAVAAGDIVLDRSADRATVRAALLALPGIGPWTADYIALRALGDPDIFLGSDLGVRQGLARLGATEPVATLAARWAPWRSYALMHVWRALEATP